MTHPSGHFSGHNISALRGCCALRFLSALEIDQYITTTNLLTRTGNTMGRIYRKNKQRKFEDETLGIQNYQGITK